MTEFRQVPTQSGEVIHVRIDGPEDGMPVLLITGFIGVADFWNPLIELMKQDFRVISYDQRGTGQSGKYDDALSMEQLADDALTILKAVAACPTVVLGHSMGACVGWILADKATEHVRAIYALGGWDKADPWMRRVFEARLLAYRDSGALAYIRATTLFMNPPAIVNCNEDAFSEAEQKMVPTIPPLSQIEDRTAAVLAFNAHAFQPAIDVPMRIACAADDWMTPIALSENLLKMNRHASFRKFDIGGHYLPKSQAIHLQQDFQSWLGDVCD